ncbi:FkbM family methyltransferase, partial [Rhizobium ruizarguesonis]
TLSTQNVEEISVPTRRLDSYQFGPLGFIKIDVEGHELKVLKGSQAILNRDHPNLLIEAEDRHRPEPTNQAQPSEKRPCEAEVR